MRERSGSALLFPVGDLAQHLLASLLYLVQNGYGIFDDVNDWKIPDSSGSRGSSTSTSPYPLSFVEQLALTELTVELATSCYAGVLTLQAMGLGGWMFDGIDPFSMLGAPATRRSRGSASGSTWTSAGRSPT